MKSNNNLTTDQSTADAFATSWNNLPKGSVYTYDQFEDWMLPLERKDFEHKRVLELGCGNGSLIVHLLGWNPVKVDGVDLGDSVRSAEKNISNKRNVSIIKGDLTLYRAEVPYDIVYCIGVLHHLKEPQKGFSSVLDNTAPHGKFHCWVYAKEGNGLVLFFVEPLRRITSRLSWWITKYFIATPLAAIFYIYAKLVKSLSSILPLSFLPLYAYALWIAKREFLFFRHVAFDQLVTPQTRFISKSEIEEWLQDERIKPGSTYVINRNGNSWKFGGIKN